MAEESGPLKIDYDRVNDVLRILAEDVGEAIAVPSEHTTVLVSDSLDRCIGLVFESYLAGLKGSLSRAISDLGDDFVLEVALNAVESVAEPLMSQCAPTAKDAVARWLEIAPPASTAR